MLQRIFRLDIMKRVEKHRNNRLPGEVQSLHHGNDGEGELSLP